ncbi:HNH endonuclease, partial [Bacilli bacterium]
PNCHAMIHRGSKVLTLDTLKEIIKKNEKIT